MKEYNMNIFYISDLFYQIKNIKYFIQIKDEPLFRLGETSFFLSVIGEELVWIKSESEMNFFDAKIIKFEEVFRDIDSEIKLELVFNLDLFKNRESEFKEDLYI